jgi:soluble lytic murein transglycosylase
MQLMPATARFVARKVGMNDYAPARINEIDVNLRLGTGYLRMVLDDLDGHPVLATAAYNAGPGRPRLWRSTLARAVEGAIFAETIPFNETRDYVKKVMSNSVYYAALFESKAQSLKARLGTVAPKAVGTTELP